MKQFAFILIVCLASTMGFCADNVIRMTSLDWKPYTGEALIDNGFSTSVARAAFQAMGYEMDVSFFPWKRAILTAKEDLSYQGYFPEYYSKDVEKEFLYSDSFGKSPIGFIKKPDTVVKWQGLDQLSEHKIGTVQGYVNSPEFDEMVAQGKLTVESSPSDIVNIRKVAEGRIPLALIDQHVFEYLMSSQEDLQKYANDVEFFHILDQIDLYLCFNKSEKGRKALKIFNQGLKKIDTKRIQQASLDLQELMLTQAKLEKN